MQIIPINDEEAAVIEKKMQQVRETSAVAQTMFFSISPLASPKRRDSVSVNDKNLHKQIILNKLEDVIKHAEEHAEEQEQKYANLQNKINRFNLK
jgi:hypothetical protein